MSAATLISSYLGAIVAANLLVTHFGKWALPFTAFVLIPFDLVARDLLHEKWSKASEFGLYSRMYVLICSGALLSYLINQNSQRIAIASCVTFGIVGLVNTMIYQYMAGQARFKKMNVSNCFAAIVDSTLFPLIAFSIFDPKLFIFQSLSKTIGGVIWAYIFLRRINQ